jgi:glycosyltransferase involved in cell wall biosynthesis
LHKEIALIVPFHNEAKYLEDTFSSIDKFIKIHKKLSIEVVFVNNFSNDGGPQILKDKLATYDPSLFKLVNANARLGKGYACKVGIEKSCGKLIVFFDADLEYDINDLLLLFNSIKLSGANLILGSRYHNRFDYRKMGNKFYEFYFNIGGVVLVYLFNLIFNSKLKDPASMWVAIDRDYYNSLDIRGQSFDFCWEIVAKSLMNKEIIQEIPVKYTSRGVSQGKKIKLFKDPVFWLFKFLLWRITKR